MSIKIKHYICIYTNICRNQNQQVASVSNLICINSNNNNNIYTKKKQYLKLSTSYKNTTSTINQ